MKRSNKIWTTTYGKRMKIAEMETEHILNCVRRISTGMSVGLQNRNLYKDLKIELEFRKKNDQFKSELKDLLK